MLQLIMDSLRYWVHRDARRRLPLRPRERAARELYDVDRLGAFFDIIHQDPVLSQVKLIAEPWDLGEGGYQVGNFPVLWTEWNGKYRDTVRRFWQGRRRHGVGAGHSAGRQQRSLRIRAAASRTRASISSPRTTASRCTISSATTTSTTRRTAKTTATATNNNLSWNCGVEGPTDDPAINAIARAPEAQLAGHAAAVAGRPHDLRTATSSAARSTATTTPIARTTRSAGSTGTSPTSRSASWSSRASLSRSGCRSRRFTGASTFRDAASEAAASRTWRGCRPTARR